VDSGSDEAKASQKEKIVGLSERFYFF